MASFKGASSQTDCNSITTVMLVVRVEPPPLQLETLARC